MTIATMGRRMKKFPIGLPRRGGVGAGVGAAGGGAVWGEAWAGSLAATVATTTMPSRLLHPSTITFSPGLTPSLEDPEVADRGPGLTFRLWAFSRRSPPGPRTGPAAPEPPVGGRAARLAELCTELSVEPGRRMRFGLETSESARSVPVWGSDRAVHEKQAPALG